MRIDTSLEGFVQEAIQAHVTMLRQQQADDQLAKDYDELALMYPDLMAELADEVWLPLESGSRAPSRLAQCRRWKSG